MAEAVNTITTRQRAEPILHTEVALGAGESFENKVYLVAGFNTLSILAISDQAFSVTVDESCDTETPFTRTQTIASEVDAAGNQRICTRINPCGNYAIITLVNGGAPQSFLSFCVLGIPE